MSQGDYATIDAKTSGDRTVMHVLYAMHTLAWASMYTLAVIATIVNYIRRSDEHDSFYAAHHSWMISTFWWAVLWAIVCLPLYLLLFFPGAIAHAIVGLWYLYRCIKGWLRFSDGRLPT
ncbi:MAG: DUF4870 family protein [Ramlibacter sp.]